MLPIIISSLHHREGIAVVQVIWAIRNGAIELRLGFKNLIRLECAFFNSTLKGLT